MSVDQLLNPACNYVIYCDQVIPKYGTGSEGDVILQGAVFGSGSSGLIPIVTTLSPTLNLPSTTANETFNYDPSQLDTQLILQNNVPLSASIERNHILLMNSSGYGFDLSQDSTVSNPNGSFQLVALPSEVSAFFFDPATSPPVFTFNTNVTMQEDLNMDNREIHNLNMAGSPAPTDAVNVAYVNGLIGSDVTLTTDSGSATASASVINVNAKNIAGSSVTFSGSGNTMQLHTSDSSNNTMVGNLAGNNTITGTSNSGFGVDVLHSLTSGINNTGMGLLALNLNTVGNYNTAVGVQALQSNVSGSSNSAFGVSSLQRNTTGTTNCAFGYLTLSTNTSGSNNTGIGDEVLVLNTIGSSNTACGQGSLQVSVSGVGNSALGHFALGQVTIGSSNVGIGDSAGFNYTTSESNNICIGAAVGGTPGESNVTRIGSGSTSCYIAGITGVSVGTSLPVVVNSSGQLGTGATTPLPTQNFIVYVNKGGNDSTGNGSIDMPFLTVSHAMSTITYATSSQNVQIVVGPGTYANAFSIKANVDIVGQQTDRTTLTGSIDLNDASWNNANDNRSSFINITIGAAIILDFTVQSATAGKFYLNGVTFNGAFTINGYNAINQLICRNSLFFSNYTQTGVTAILDSSTNLGGVTTCNSSALAGNPTSLTLYGGGSSGNLVVSYTSTNTVNATLIGCPFTGTMSASGALASISYTTGTIPFPAGITLSGGATSTKLTQ